MSHFNVSLIVWAKPQDSVHKSQFLKRRESRSGSNRGPSGYQPSALPLGHAGSFFQALSSTFLTVLCLARPAAAPPSSDHHLLILQFFSPLSIRPSPPPRTFISMWGGGVRVRACVCVCVCVRVCMWGPNWFETPARHGLLLSIFNPSFLPPSPTTLPLSAPRRPPPLPPAPKLECKP